MNIVEAYEWIMSSPVLSGLWVISVLGFAVMVHQGVIRRLEEKKKDQEDKKD